MAEYPITRRVDGKYEQGLGDRWLIEYWEDPNTGLWRVDVYHRDVPEWMSEGHASIEEAERAVRNYLDQL